MHVDLLHVWAFGTEVVNASKIVGSHGEAADAAILGVHRNRTCASERIEAAADAVSGEKFEEIYVAIGFLMSRLDMACLHGTESIVFDAIVTGMWV